MSRLENKNIITNKIKIETSQLKKICYFFSKDFTASPITILYKATGKAFPIVMTLGQMTIPFYIVYGLKQIINKKRSDTEYSIS